MSLSAGHRIGPYEIVVPIGAGGMGEVYRATDARLGRDVALKVLPPGMASDPDRLARFQREARAVAALNHPNVVTLYSVEECDGVHFLTMELIEGRPLDQMISANGLPADRIIEIAAAMAEALAAAHDKGIVHRDLKPANVMVTHEGRVKVLDFGLAKDTGAKPADDATLTSAGHTRAGMVMGTPAYMSPEQLSGRPLDHRTDIFSLGVVLHEMSTGKPPFGGTSSAELISAILRDTPPPVTELRADLPGDLARVIRRCLEKDPRHRMQTARDVSNEFRDLARMFSGSSGVSAASAPSSGTRLALTASGESRADEGFWVAVLPFTYKGAGPDLDSLAEGLVREIITGFSRFSYMRVISSGSSARYASESADVRKIGKDLGARYVLEGNLRQAGTRLRITVQLLDTSTGAHLWVETYDRAFLPGAVFDLQDELVPKIVSTVADGQGVLPHNMGESLRSRGAADLSPYEAVLRSFAYTYRISAEEHRSAREALEVAVERAPHYAPAWAMLSVMFREEYCQGFNLRPAPLERAYAAARRAVEIAPSDSMGFYALASVQFHQHELSAFRSSAELALAINPMEGGVLAYLGFELAYAGDWDRGCALTKQARSLNPRHPGWYWFADAFDAFRQGNYRETLAVLAKINMPGFWRRNLALAATQGHLGEVDAARIAVRALLAAKPDFAATAREECSKWWQPALVEQLLDGLRKAGLELCEDESKPGVSPVMTGSDVAARSAGSIVAADSGAVRADEGFWVAVLPFKFTGASADLKDLAEGIFDEVITGLSRFSYLRVIARGSTAKYSNESGDIRAIGRELGARYVMEGSLRQAGNKLRVTVQLADTISGAHLWAETYERVFMPETLFEVQDDLVPRIVSTVADQYGVLPRSMSDVLRSRSANELTPHEAVLRAFNYFTHITPEEHGACRNLLERIVRDTPDHADSWAMLSMVYRGEFAQGYNAQPNPLDRALAAAQRAVELAPTHALGHYALATVYFFRKETVPFRVSAERTLMLNPLDASVKAYLGLLTATSGEWERGCRMVESAMQLNPNCPGIFYAAAAWNAYRQGNYAEVLVAVARANIPRYYHVPAIRAAALGQLGRQDEARRALEDLLAIRPDFAQAAREEYAKWLQPQLVEHMLDGLRKAGLEIPDAAPAPSGFSGSAVLRSASGAASAEEGFWVAVLPFKSSESRAELGSLAEGLSEEIVTGLSRFSYLRVVAHGSTAQHSSVSGSVRAIGQELGARYVVEGNVRQAGNKLRVTVQLADTVSGAHLWAETYERVFTPEAIFEVQDDLVPRIVATVADQYGVLPRSMSDVLRGKNSDDLTPHEAVLRAFSYFTRVTPEEHAAVRSILERAVQDAPDHADCWAMLSMLYRGEFAQGYNAGPNSLDRALVAAQRAVELAPTHALGHHALATVCFFRKEMVGFRISAERALALNPLDASVQAYLGLLIASSGDWERGCQMVESAMKLKRNNPGWFHNAKCCNAYRQGNYSEVLEQVALANMPRYYHSVAIRAAALGQLGRPREARKAIEDLLALRPDFAQTARDEYTKWLQPELVEHILDGLRKAGLQVPEDVTPADSSPIPENSGKVKSGDPSIAVLPFANISNDPDQEYFSDGLAEEIINALAHVSGLKVIAALRRFPSKAGTRISAGLGRSLG